MAEEWGCAMEASDSISANHIHDRLQSLYLEIANRHEEEDLFRQVNNQKDVVRFFIASHLKNTDLVRAIQAYKALEVSNIPFIAVSSRYILRDLAKS